MCLIISDKSRPMCLVVHVFCIEKVLSINEGCVITMLWHAPDVSSYDQFSSNMRFIQWSLAQWMFLDILTQSGACMCLITSDKMRPMCLVVHVFCIEKMLSINKGSIKTVLQQAFAVFRFFSVIAWCRISTNEISLFCPDVSFPHVLNSVMSGSNFNVL